MSHELMPVEPTYRTDAEPLSLAQGVSVIGLLDRTVPHDSTAELLKSLGADDAKASATDGQCVLGRGGLEVDIELKKQIEQAKSQL